MEVTKDTYFSKEAAKEYNGVSQYKSFMYYCPSKARAKLEGDYEEPTPDYFLIGSYVHAWSEGLLRDFKINHLDELYKNSGVKKYERGGITLEELHNDYLYSKFEICDKMIERLQHFEVVDYYLTGEKEVIITFEIMGYKWKAMVDVLNLDRGYFVDLKTTADLNSKRWNDDYTAKVPFFIKFNYPLQMAVYQYGLHQVFGKWLTPYIVAVDKTDVPDVAIYKFDDQNMLDAKMEEVIRNSERYHELKHGAIEDVPRCEECGYCKLTKKIEGVVNVSEILAGE